MVAKTKIVFYITCNLRYPFPRKRFWYIGFSTQCAQLLHIYTKIDHRMTDQNLFHAPVLKKEILALLLFDQARTVFDGTLGLGGHAQAILEQFPGIERYIACDLDAQHLAFAQKRLEKWHQKTVFVHDNFVSIKKIIQNYGIPRPLVILLDLGLCSNHLDDADKGFAFMAEGPLHMNFNVEGTQTAADILNQSSEEELATILKEYGEEPLAKKLARKMVEARQQQPFQTTTDLRVLVEANVHPKDRKKALMRVFQAIRIAVNDELNVLQNTLQAAIDVMQAGDRMGVISYHSLEDRLVKKFFVLQSKPKTIETELSLHTEVAPAVGRLLSKKPIAPSEDEIAHNPRARSARLRLFEKTT